MRVAPALAAGVVLLAGCLSSPLDGLEEVAAVEDGGGSASVVLGFIDTGIDPWHAAFALSDTSTARPPLEAEVVPQAFRGALEERGLAAWNDLEPDTLYWFEGTRVLGISLLRNFEPMFSEVDPHRIYDDVGHGISVASVAAMASPHAWILMMETDALYLDAIRWAAAQPWLDVISISVGRLGHLPGNLTTGRDLFADAFLDAVASGKLAVTAGGNYPDPNLLSHTGAPWMISVGGAQGGRRGVTPFTSQPVDVVANFTVEGIAGTGSPNRTGTGQGTSLGAPLVAGVLAEAVYELRARHGQETGITDGALVNASGVVLTNQDLRWALNMSARYWGTSEWSPGVDPQGSPTREVGNLTNPPLPQVAGTPVGPWLQMGWGYVDASTAQDIVALFTGEAAPPVKADAAAYMEALFEARAAVWDLYQDRPVAAREGFEGNL